MKKNYLLMAAAAMVLASCSSESDAPEGGEVVNNDQIALSTLTPASQAGRISDVNGTRDGEKKERLQLKYKVAPVADAKSFGWSATGIALDGGNVYVSWHSDFQAANPATKWGGALDVIAFNGESAPAFSNTYVNYDAKFNGVLVGNSAFYLALTDSKKGAAVARVKAGETDGVIRAVSGSSANALSMVNGRVCAATGYKNGGVFSIDANFVSAADGKAHVDTLVLKDGCKFIDGDLVLRTDATAAYLCSLDGTQEWNIGAPLKSEEKNGEKYDPVTGTWSTDNETSAAYYGKHTMASDDKYIYVAGGQAAAGSKDGLRVIDKATKRQVWGNATNTTAVCVAGDYVYAATGAGLRVYKKFDGTNLELFAYETITDANGKVVAGTDAHSCNFVAVDGNYIYMANGQSGVYVFTLDTTAPAPETPAE